MISIGNVIKRLRILNNVSQQEMSEKLGVSCQTISKWENEKTYPDICMIPDIAAFFHVTIDALFHGNIKDSNEVITDMDKGYLDENRIGWNQVVSNAWSGTILPAYGPYTPSEEELKLFDNITDKTVLELACGDGRSLLYQAEHGAKELYGLDISETQIAKAKKNFEEKHINSEILTEEFHSL